MIISSNTESLLGWLMEKRLEVKRDFCKTREVRAWIRHVHWFRIGKDLQLWRVSRWPKRKIVWTGKACYGIVSRTEASTPEEDVSISRKEKWRKEVQTCIFNADDSSVTMVMDLISSANDICIAFGICDYLGKFNEIDVESRRNSASVVPYSKSRRTSLSLDLGLLQLKMSQVVLR